MVGMACVIFIDVATKLGDLSDHKVLTMSFVGCLLLISAMYLLSSEQK